MLGAFIPVKPPVTKRVLFVAGITAPTVNGANADKKGESAISPFHVTVDKR